eukprot:2095232-Pleurochrysis_carterae.AAC.1
MALSSQRHPSFAVSRELLQRASSLVNFVCILAYFLALFCRCGGSSVMSLNSPLEDVSSSE